VAGTLGSVDTINGKVETSSPAPQRTSSDTVSVAARSTPIDPLITGFEIGSTDGVRWVYCPQCQERVNRSIVPHLKRKHPDTWKEFCNRFAVYRQQGLTYQQIMWRFRRIFSWTVIERALAETGQDRPPPRKVKLSAPLEPSAAEDVRPSTTVWEFERRGSWGVHDGRYRGNWPPQIPRNLILRYTNPGDVVLDPFVGGGTTALESYALGRRFIGYDINEAAIEQTRRKIERLQQLFDHRLPLYPEQRVGKVTLLCGDARAMRAIRNESVQLVCAHPPYLDMIRYTRGIPGDLSAIKDPDEFGVELGKVAKECLRVLKPGGYCAVLIGDVRRDGRFIDLGFLTKSAFIAAGFVVHENIIKYQHKGQGTKVFWERRQRRLIEAREGEQYDRTRDLLLIAHEYLFIFRKPSVQSTQSFRVATDVVYASKSPEKEGQHKQVTSKPRNVEF
jgi:DNA modification methylase